MITRMTKIQLVIFAIVTIIGGAFVGGRYAQVDRLVVDRSYPITAQFSDSGGIFAGAQVTYRGIPVGEVAKLQFDNGGVKATLDIENSAPDIPSDVTAIVANKSAIGEQFIDLQPQSDAKPYLASGSVIPLGRTRIPIDTTTLLVDVNNLVTSVDTDNLRTVVDELGQAFEGTGPDLARILDTSSDFIQTADANIDVTRSLIRDSDSVLQTQIDKRGQLATFSKNLALLSDTLVDADPDLRRLLDKGGDSAATLRKVVDENSEDLGNAIRDLVIANKPLADNVLGLQAVFILYPYLLEGSFTALVPNVTGGKETGDYNAKFGLVLTDTTPTCTYAQNGGDASGYRKRLGEGRISDVQFDVNTDCKVKDNKIARQPSKTVLRRSAAGTPSYQGSTATGKDSWKWLLSDPVNQ
ncbi:MCE family protein [Aeromicrobium fastidiosum]|uniref:MCE family protein n=2 Tax=Aeromicrobium fastidiosum TaxID=52699 RepID=A0A641AJ83_9ACTN|nr:MCE family protein [Aeromicrobium fastidiosum]MBP2390693.1 phospholipid/cholesterol/gamma-HCH transport system substrate-binding protein [Aeromicrobium fastidiosum]